MLSTISARLALLAAALACLPAAALAQSGPAAPPAPPPANGPPVTAREPVEEVLHGQTVVDPYRWLEGDDEGKSTERVSAWTDAQNAYTRAALDALPGREALAARLEPLLRVDAVGLPRAVGGRVFYTRRAGDQDQAVLYVREGDPAQERALLDANTLDEKALVSLDWYAPSHDGELLAFGLSRAGDENSTLHVLEVASGEWRADTIPNKVGSPDWLPDGSGFFYSRLRDVADPYSREVRFHRLGTHTREDVTLFAQHSPTWGPFGSLSEDGHWLLLGYFTSTRANDLWAVDVDHWRRTGEVKKKDLLVGADAKAFGVVLGDTLYMETNLDAPNGRVLAVDLTRPARERWRELVPERKDATLRDVSLARGMLVLTYLKNASTEIVRVALDGARIGRLELPGIGSASVSVTRERSDGFLSFTSYATPRTIYRVDLATGEREEWARSDVPVDPELAEVSQVWFPSKDGTKVSMFLVHKKGLVRNGQNPTLLYGYGGFNISLTPYFDATLAPWLEAGGVYAVPNLRGGGEYGADWHRAGQLERKQNVFDDFFAAAEWLIAEKITSPAKLAIAGGSNGGLLTGAALVQRPELFRAAISSVPLLDMLRYQRFLMARFWVPEYGSAEDPAQFPFLRAYSPYHNVKPGVRYPAVLLTAGENDSRVHPLHARKMAAALQAATASDPSERPVLLWVEREAGHGSGKPLSLRIRDIVDQRAFLMKQLGMQPEPAAATPAVAPLAPR